MTKQIVPTRLQILGWMRANHTNFVDQSCNVLDCTGLAEACASRFEAVENSGAIPEVFFEVAVDLNSKLVEQGKLND